MKRVLKITAKKGGTTAKVRIEVECTKQTNYDAPRRSSRETMDSLADGVMRAIEEADYLGVPLSRQCIGR